MMQFVKQLKLFICITLIIVYFAASAEATDDPKALVPLLNPDAVKWIEIGGGKFLANYIKSSRKKTYGSVILLHDWPGSLIQPQLIAPLQKLLSKHGWNVLSINLWPFPKDEKAFEKHVKTLAKAKAIFSPEEKQENKDDSAKPILVIAYGKSALIALMAATNETFINGVVVISADIEKDAKKSFAAAIKKEIPILEIKADLDYQGIEDGFSARQYMSLENKKYYRQVELLGAKHSYTDLEPIVLKKIQGWYKTRVVTLLKDKETDKDSK